MALGTFRGSLRGWAAAVILVALVLILGYWYDPLRIFSPRIVKDPIGPLHSPRIVTGKFKPLHLLSPDALASVGLGIELVFTPLDKEGEPATADVSREDPTFSVKLRPGRYKVHASVVRRVTGWSKDEQQAVAGMAGLLRQDLQTDLKAIQNSPTPFVCEVTGGRTRT